MANFGFTNGVGGMASRQNPVQQFFTLESDDVRHQSLASRYDSGICLSTDCFSFPSVTGCPSIGGIAAPDRANELEEGIRRLEIKQEKAPLPVAHNNDSLYGNHHHHQQQQFIHQRNLVCDGKISNPSTHQTPSPHGTNSIPSSDPFQQDEDGDTQLHLSIIKPDAGLAMSLIEAGQFTDRLDIQNDHLHTALHLAVITDQPQLVRALVVSGACLSARDRTGNTPLHLACKLGHADCVERLTTPPNHEELRYVWMESSKMGISQRTVNYVKQNDMALFNYEGDTCLHVALSSVAASKFDILNYLLNVCGADVNAQEGKCGFSLLHQAVRLRDAFTVHFLLQQRNVAINQICYNGYTPLDIAVSLNQSHHLADVLKNAGAATSITAAAASSAAFDSDGSSSSQDDGEFDDLMIAGRCAGSV